MKLEGLDHIAISVADPAASEAWYRDVLGLERHHKEVWGDFPVFMMASTTGLAIFPQSHRSRDGVRYEGVSEFRHLAFRADREGFEQAQAELAARGVATEFEDHKVSHSIYFEDPDGFRLEITTYDLGDSREAAVDAETAFFRHSLATLAYRGDKAIRGAGEGFAEFRLGDATRTPGEILAHIGDVLDWALSQAEGRQVWRESQSLPWDKEVERFFSALDRLDRRLATGEPTGFSVRRMFQGPIADALTHVGQIAMLRRLAGRPVRGENYFEAEVEVGQVGENQAEPVREFD